MAKAGGRRWAESGTVDMNCLPEVESGVFEHPDCDDCWTALDHDVQVDDTIVIRDFQRHCKGRMVFFSLQLSRIVAGVRSAVARIDTAHGEVHIHTFSRDDVEVSRNVICPIPVDSASKVLDDAYQDAYQRLLVDGPALIEGW